MLYPVTDFISLCHGIAVSKEENVSIARCFFFPQLTFMSVLQRFVFGVLLTLLFPCTAIASDPVPDAGRVIRDQRQLEHTVPSDDDDSVIDESQHNINVSEKEEGFRVRIDSITIQGNYLFDDSDLRQIFREALGSELSFSDMRWLAARITAFYREQGYVFARAYLPPQEINNHNLTIAVIEGHFGEVKIHNTSDAPDVLLSELWPGDAIKLPEMERSLLLLSDTPGINVKSSLKPGERVGTADLLIDIANGKRYDGVVSMDNYGSHSTGENRLNGAMYLYNPFNQGDQLNVRLTTTDEQLYFGGIDYYIPIGADGYRFGASYERVDYTLGSDFESLNAHGTADIIGVDLEYPFIRSRLRNLYGKIAGEVQSLHDYIDFYDESTQKMTTVLGLSLYGNNRDGWFGGGSNVFSLSLNYGNLDIDKSVARTMDDLTAETRGSYTMLDINLQRMQSLTRNTRLYLMLSGQLASKNLTSAEKFSLGGPFGVRAYPQGEATGDEGALATVEVRYMLTPQINLKIFADGGFVTINKEPWLAESNHRDLFGYGLGLDWVMKSGLSLKTGIAWKGGGELPTADVDRVPRVWGQVLYRL